MRGSAGRGQRQPTDPRILLPPVWMQQSSHLGGAGGGAAAHRWYFPSARRWARTGEAPLPQTGAGTARPQEWGSEGFAPQHHRAPVPDFAAHEKVLEAATRYQGPLLLMATGEARLVVVPSPSCPAEFQPLQPGERTALCISSPQRPPKHAVE